MQPTTGITAEDDLVITQSGQIETDLPVNFTSAQLDALVFGVAANGLVDDVNQSPINLVIQRKIRELTVQYGLNQVKQDRLNLAAQADKARFDREFDALRQNFDAMPKTRNNFMLMRKEAMALREQFRSFLRPESFFAKAAKSILADVPRAKWQTPIDDELQTGRFQMRPRITVANPRPFINQQPVINPPPVAGIQAVENSRDDKDQLLNRHRSNIESAIRAVDRFVELTNLQRQQLVDLMLREFEPPKSDENYALVLMKYRFSRLPEEKLKPLFQEQQWPKVLRAIEVFRKIEPVLISHRLIDSGEILSDQPADAVTPVNRSPN